ncbi:hypothetical protein GCM10010371_35690 [Streptomyces subrutilus]|uniref:Uncharacterized protein n=1 Tax=Streptomyces subrutilus TaxID=36818 RepID=A0A5P2UT23_9ACTN|nr:chloride channel protein [Streptomyces subrutilus]QEU82020.1 hypothetical protein CP968_30455 [Streptomyces subrutilus]GGZ72630.1 hypothetical protein GCM10010371_35690 [Streptomyces subrutilus]
MNGKRITGVPAARCELRHPPPPGPLPDGPAPRPGGARGPGARRARTIRTRLVRATLIGTATAVACSRLLVGGRPVFEIPLPDAPALALLPVFLLFGAASGVLGAADNSLVTGAPACCDRITRVGPVARAAVIGAVVGLLLGIDPPLAGGGDELSGPRSRAWRSSWR